MGGGGAPGAVHLSSFSSSSSSWVPLPSNQPSIPSYGAACIHSFTWWSYSTYCIPGGHSVHTVLFFYYGLSSWGVYGPQLGDQGHLPEGPQGEGHLAHGPLAACPLVVGLWDEAYSGSTEVHTYNWILGFWFDIGYLLISKNTKKYSPLRGGWGIYMVIWTNWFRWEGLHSTVAPPPLSLVEKICTKYIVFNSPKCNRLQIHPSNPFRATYLQMRAECIPAFAVFLYLSYRSGSMLKRWHWSLVIF